MAGEIKHYWNGTVLTITSDSGTTSCDLKGEKGDDGCRGPMGVCNGTHDGSGTGTPGEDGVGISNIYQKTISLEDGGENVYVVELTDGTISNFTVRNGNKGSDGKTPVKGTDYFTEADKAEMIADTVAAMPETDLSNYYTKAQTNAQITAAKPDLTPYAKKTDLNGLATETYVSNAIAAIPDTDLTNYYTKAQTDAAISADLSGYVKTVNNTQPDANGNVAITATVETPIFVDSIGDDADTNKLYVLPDGFIYAYMPSDVPAYTNHANPSSADWLKDKRFATSSINDFTGAYITNYIPCKPGDTIRMRGMDVVSQISSSPARTRMFYDGESRGIADYYVKTLVNNGYGSYDAATGTYTFQLVDLNTGEALAYDFNAIRQNFLLMDGYTEKDVIITVNEEIKNGSGYAWTNTGHAFIAADYEDRIINLEAEAEAQEKRIKLLEEYESGIPSYWQEELSTKADAIQQAMEAAGRNKSAFLWYSDAHWENNSKKSPLLLDYLIRNTPMNRINFGGDIVGNPTAHTHENIKYVYDWRQQIAGLPNHHSVAGNHDLNHNTTDVRDMAYAYLIAPEECPEMIIGNGLYYYIDVPCEKTRYLYLDYMTSKHTEMVEQGNFIVDAIKGVESGWHIVVIAHRWYQYTSASTPTVGSIPAYEKDILAVLDAYNARATRTASNYFATQDFTDGKGKVELCIGGHIHVDYDLNTDGGIPIILTASDTNQERSSDEIEDCGTIGTTTEAAVYGIVADYTNSKIKVIGIGRGTCREITL